MRFRCRRCGARTDHSAAMSRHVVDEHGRSELGWDVVRVPESRSERPVAWLSNLPIRIRARCGNRGGQ
ncbi:hypothetical protein DV707_15870 (plasmid) [Halobellus limi]|uniref:C2H2-type domain-containing protein n=2 Tax=Halobellus limi TaxID=699433 RepID=A0A1H6BAD7_9EURY|nr:hypothetical protein DV707_15870 [Halobellus limi]SEG57749.1 hypothetical protein SAMN04488133_2700 [Halobellus limi]